MEERQNSYIKPKQMSYKYWLVGMIAQGMANNSDCDSEDFANTVVDRVDALLERLRADKMTQRNNQEDYNN